MDSISILQQALSDFCSQVLLDTSFVAKAFKQFILLPKGWVVERTLGWLTWCRRLNKDYELLPETAKTFVYIAMIRIIVRRLA